MEPQNQEQKLWQGGAWERPNDRFTPPPAVVIPVAAPERPALRTRKKRRKWPAFLGISALCAGAIFLRQTGPRIALDPSSPYWWQEEENTSTEPPSIPRAETGTGVTVELQPHIGLPLNLVQVYEKNCPSVVSIESETPKAYFSGTGVILTENGYIITNAHVVAGADLVSVSFSDNRVLSAELVGFDSQEDLAVLKVDASGLQPAEFGDSDLLQVGEAVSALGDPLGYRSSLTDGIVSSLNREVNVDGIKMVLIQTNAAINFGNSGGPLLNEYGQVVGINTVKIVSDDGSAESLGFAIPSRRVKYVADTLIDGREVQTGMFGFTVNRHPAPSGGLEIRSVETKSDAYAQGIRAGDIILFANGTPVNATQDLARLKLGLGPGDIVALTCLRNGEEFTVDVALIEAAS